MTQKHNLEIALKNLEAEARAASSKEAYHQVFNNKENRIGVSVVIKVDGKPEYIMEFILCALPANSKVDLSHLEKVLKIVKTLIEKDYTVFHRDDGWIICEKILEPGDVNSETEFLKAIVAKHKDYKIK